MFLLAKSKGESINAVRERFKALIAGKRLVGYHLPQKIADFGLLDESTLPQSQNSDKKSKFRTPDKND